MGNLGWTEILVILVIALIIFGPRKLPELGKSLGQSLAQFRRASEDFKRTWEQEVEVEKRRLDAPPAIRSEPDYGDSNQVDLPETAGNGSTLETPSVSTQEPEANPATVKRDWM
jgi:TatA/E family protein of Tat protein translocase